MKNLKNVMSVVAFALVMLISVNVSAQSNKTGPIVLIPGNSTIPDDISKQHNDVCLDIMRNAKISNAYSFKRNQEILNNYLTDNYSAKIVKTLSVESLSTPYSLLKVTKKNISRNFYLAMDDALNKTKGKTMEEMYDVLDGLIIENSTYFNLTIEESKNFQNLLTLFKGSLELWSSIEMSELALKKGFQINNKMNKLMNMEPEPEDYWKIAAADFVSSFAGLWAGPVGAVGGAIIGSANMYISQS